MVATPDALLEQLARDFPLLQRKILLRVVHAAQGEIAHRQMDPTEVEVVARRWLAALSDATSVRSA